MINVFNRKILVSDTDSKAVANVWSTLRAGGIKYELHTKTHSSSFRRMLTQQRNIGYNMGGTPASWQNYESAYLYIVYVNKKDYAKAKELCNL
ncbi:MAG: hypothetical protein E7571_04680 [Ruminococcaceae bacterium]|nr:hypothetical protein [Oscillospiraceae bacterium]